MDDHILNRAKKLQENIRQCKHILRSDVKIEYFSGIEWSKYVGKIVHSFPEDLTNDILNLIKERLSKYEKELKEL